MKKTLFFFFAFCLSVTALQAQSKLHLYGDLNHDGVVNDADLELLSNLILREVNPEEIDPSQPATAIVEAQRVTLNKSLLSLKPEGQSTLKVTITPSNSTFADCYWQSSDTSVATVSQTGVVTAHAIGSATITVWLKFNPALKAVCNVTVTDGSGGGIDNSNGTGEDYVWGN